MIRLSYTILVLSSLLIIGCSDDSDLASSPGSSNIGISADSFADGASVSEGTTESSGTREEEAGLITAGEWNDLDNWDFWTDIIGQGDHADKPGYWTVFPSRRISVHVAGNFGPMVDAELRLVHNGNTVWTNRTDNFGNAELWVNPFEEGRTSDLSEYSLIINDRPAQIDLKYYEEGINEIVTDDTGLRSTRVDLSFIVDATGSMGDELEFLKQDLEDVINKVQTENNSLVIETSSVFYRDEGDEYVVRQSDFSSNLNTTIDFIRGQEANGGGDFPEAVHSALETAIENLRWSENARTRIAFLLLDAPPHHNMEVILDLQESIRRAAEHGIKVIPITASGIDKDTEFLMRFFSVLTNSTYVFITNDSGIGNFHIEPTVGDYEVEFLNDLMVRLITKYSA